MSFGLMKSFIEIYSSDTIKDSEGFKSAEDNLLLSARAYKENRHGSEAWKNRASFSKATTLFKIRKPADVEVTNKDFIIFKNKIYNILSVEDIREKGMYLEILAEKTEGSKG